MNFKEIIGTEAGLVTGDFMTVAPRSFLPKGLHLIACQGSNLNFIGFQADDVSASAIGLNEEHAYMACLGEYFERYCASYHRDGDIQGTYNELKNKERIVAPDSLKFYAEWQYDKEDFPFKKLENDSHVSWTRGTDLNGDSILIPSCLAYFAYRSDQHDNGVEYLQRTSTGMASGSTVANSIKGGFLECAERHAFSNFWYNQRDLVDDLPIYDAQTVLEAYPDDKDIQRLFNNPRVKIMVIDLVDLGDVHTAVSVILFPYKGEVKMSLGASSRFSKPEAIVKATLEAYQGVEYILSLEKKHEEWIANLSDLKTVDNFGKHFIYYTAFPEQRDKVPILKRLFHQPNFSPVSRLLADDTDKLKSMDDARDKMGTNIIVVDMSIAEISELGFNIVRVIVPGWSYLTASHSIQHLGADIFKENDRLFTELPHPFP